VETYRIHEGASLYYLTFTVQAWLPVFVGEAPCLLIADSLNRCHQDKGLCINAYVIMPTHIHLIVFDADFDSRRLSATVTAFRKFTGRRLADYCAQHMPEASAAVLARHRRSDRERQFWQQSRHPEAIVSQSMWQQKLRYLHDNPRRKGLVRQATYWRFSSAAYWTLGEAASSDVVLSAIEW